MLNDFLSRPVLTVITGVALLAAGVAVGCGGSNGGGSPTSPSPPGGSGSSPTTISIGPNGISPKDVRVEVGQRVRFVNNDSRTHEVRSNPHPTHGECPPLNEVGLLTPGQSGMTGLLDRRGTCGFHDHLAPSDAGVQGSLLIGVTEPGPDPGYLVSGSH